MAGSRRDDPEIDPAAMARAEAALSRLTDRYLEWAERDLGRLEACLAEALTVPPHLRGEIVSRLFGIAHDMKGQGATFDYPLVSDLANRICRLLDAPHECGPEVLASITRLTAALGRVIRERMAGHGDETIRRDLEDIL